VERSQERWRNHGSREDYEANPEVVRVAAEAHVSNENPSG